MNKIEDIEEITRQPHKQRKKTRKKNMKKIIVASLLLIGIAIYIVMTIMKLVRNPTDTITLEQGTLYMEENVAGYVIREEHVIKGENNKNPIVQIKAEGEKVAKNEPVFRYYSNDEEELIKKIQELDVKIQEVMENEDTVFSTDIKNLDTQIEAKLSEISMLNDLATIKEYKKEINSYITKKAKISGDLSPAGSYKKQLIEERSSYENQLNSNSEYINADTSGVVSYRIDGLESVLGTEDFSVLSSDMLNNLNLKTGQIVATSDEQAKIINNYKCYIACSTDSEEAKNIELGSSKVKLRISGTDEVSTKLVHKNQEESGEVVLVFEINKDIEKLISYRKISVDIIWWSETGLKVPNNAIIQEEGKNYVVRTRAGYENKILVKILKQNEKYAIVDNYTVDELKEMGYTSSEISSRSKITMYDEIMLQLE